MIIAEITNSPVDHPLFPEDSQTGRTFDSEAYRNFWLDQNFGAEMPEYDFNTPGRYPQRTIQFRLYDDDNILYYEGWLLDDTNGDCTIQQFILAWAMADSGCTRIDVQPLDEFGNKREWVQIIG